MSNKISQNPLEKIALSCSGGGYRAASFHLGAMAYLFRARYQGKPLLENVKMLSTVSGGTITGVVYALMRNRGEEFPAIYKQLMAKLRSLDLVKMSIDRISKRSFKNDAKTKNLINAFAELYDEYFTEGKTFKVFDKMDCHLEAVVFNSTEFKYGINFRFRNKGTGLFGNKNIAVPPDIGEQVKLADAIAASSCFPGGFEPLIWPSDFVHKEGEKLTEFSKSSEKIGLMDGGIYDNQGIQSILLYKKGKEPYFDLVIISDVASPYMTAYKSTVPAAEEGFRSWSIEKLIGKIKSVSKILSITFFILLFLLLLVPFFWGYQMTFWTGISIGLAMVPLALLITKRILLRKAKEAKGYLEKKILSLIPAFYQSKLGGINAEKVTVGAAEPLLLDRLNSLISLLMDVFLKVVRRLNYDVLYTDEKYEYRRISNLIKELTQKDFTNKNARRPEQATNSTTPVSVLDGAYDDVVGTEIQKVAEEASEFGTTLWFSKDDELNSMLDKLVATGEFTMCYNLIEYLEKIMHDPESGYKNLSENIQRELIALHKQCLADWEVFKKGPMFMVEQGILASG